MQNLNKRTVGPFLFGLISFIVFIPHTQAQGPNNFGSGIDICTPPVQPVTLVNPTTITNCTQAGVQAALDAGGHINFDCGPNPVTIPLTSQLNLSVSTDTVLDGGGLITLDGQNSTRILHKDWHNPNNVSTINITIQNMRLINGQAPGGGSTGNHSGGAIASGYLGTSLHIINSTFEGNATTDVTTEDNQGGAIFSHNSIETVIVGSVFEGNTAGSGGAFGGISTGLFVFNSRFDGNQAQDTTSGGIVRGYGGAIALDGVTSSGNPNSIRRFHVCGSTFEDNVAVRGGGAIDVVVSDNKGIKTTFEKSIFNNNEVLGLNGQYGQGGAIYQVEDEHAGGSNEENIEILGSTFQGNKAGRQGGAVWFSILGRGEIINSTFEGNTTTAPFNTVGQGGALAITSGNVDITNVTFANNHAAYQGGAMHGGGSGNVITLKNTIFLNNTLNEQDQPSETRWQGYHTNRPMEDGGQNIQHPRLKPTYNNEVNNNITDAPIYQDPLLMPLADNGGPNWTMALQTGSPAINAGASGCPATDQRGEAREGNCDIGAYEYQASRITISPAQQTILPGQSAIYPVYVQTAPGFTQTLTLSVSNPYTTLLASLSPLTLSPNQTATLILTDTHAGTSLLPGLWHTIPVTATASGLTLTAEAQLLVGGVQLYLPVVLK